MSDVLWWVLKIFVAFSAAIVIYLIGAKMVGNFSKSDPPPDPSEIDARRRRLPVPLHRLRRPRSCCSPRPKARTRRPAALPGADGPGHAGGVIDGTIVHRLWINLWGITRLRFGSPAGKPGVHRVVSDSSSPAGTRR